MIKRSLEWMAEAFEDHFFVRATFLIVGFVAGCMAGISPYLVMHRVASFMPSGPPADGGSVGFILLAFMILSSGMALAFVYAAILILFLPAKVGSHHWAPVIGAPSLIVVGAIIRDPGSPPLLQFIGLLVWAVLLAMAGTGVWLIRSFRESDLGAERESIRITNGMRRFRRERWGIWEERQEDGEE